MKFIKDIKNFGLSRKLKDFGVTEYALNEDGSVDINENIYLNGRRLNKIPFKSNRVNGYFDISRNQLTSLKNCPKYISDKFDCSLNGLISLEFGPEYVGKGYWCCHNKLETLKGCVSEVYGNFHCFKNKLTSLEFCPMEVEGDFNCSDNQLTELDMSPFVRDTLYCTGMFNSEPEFNGSCKKLIWKYEPLNVIWSD